jgi:hypothetical protein
LTDKNQTVIERIDNFARGVANGLTLGVADYVAGAVNALFTGDGLRESMKAELKRTQDGHCDSHAGEVVGAALGAGKIAAVVHRTVDGIGFLEAAREYRELRALERATRKDLEKFLAEKGGVKRAEAAIANTFAIRRQTEVMTEVGGSVAIGTGAGFLSLATNTVSQIFGPRALEDENNVKGATSFKPKSLLGITPK